MKEAAKNYRTFTQDWYCLFPRILGQICPMMVQQLQRSKSWNIVEGKSDPAELMKLIQKVCLHGGNNAYIPDTFLTILNESLLGNMGHKLLLSMMNKLGPISKYSVISSSYHLVPPYSPCFLFFRNM